MLRAASSTAVLFVFWVALSGYFTPFLLVSGLVCSIAVVWVAHRMAVMDHEGHPIQLGLVAVTYWPWLAKEIVKSAWDVTKVILNPRLPVQPTLVRFKPTQRSELGMVIHANSITLTPGTISIEVSRDTFLVHALTAASAEGVKGDDMDGRVTKIESRA